MDGLGLRQLAVADDSGETEVSVTSTVDEEQAAVPETTAEVEVRIQRPSANT